MTRACPECDSSQFNRRLHMSPTCKCKDCGAEFEEPVERSDRRGEPKTLHGRVLEDLNPEEFPPGTEHDPEVFDEAT